MNSILPRTSFPCEICGASALVWPETEPARCSLCGRLVCRAHVRPKGRALWDALVPTTCTECTPPRRQSQRLFRAVIVLLAGLPGLIGAQQRTARDEGGRPALPSDSVPHTVAEAEAQGTRHGRSAANNPRRDWDSAAKGTTERSCVDADKVSIAQSGDFIAGPFALYNENWHNGYGKLTWQPAVVSDSTLPRLTVRATRLDTPNVSRVFEGFALTHSREGPTKFYITGAHVPTAGRWMLVATAGANWGCFIHTVG